MPVVINGTTGITTPTESVATTIGVGGATPSGSGAGITFPATQSASTDANTLDDYEEGTWTPVMSGSFTYSSRSGRYTKIGNVVTITGAVTWSANSSAAVQLAVSGFPFVVGDVRVAGSIGYTAGVDNGGGKQLIVTSSSPATSFDYWSINDNGTPNTVGADACSATGELQFAFVYRTS